jgi:hypothetical protein
MKATPTRSTVSASRRSRRAGSGADAGVKPDEPKEEHVAFAKGLLERGLPFAEEMDRVNRSYYLNYMLPRIWEETAEGAWRAWLKANDALVSIAKYPAELVAHGAPLRIAEDRLRDALEGAAAGDEAADLTLRRNTAGMLLFNMPLPVSLRQWLAGVIERTADVTLRRVTAGMIYDGRPFPAELRPWLAVVIEGGEYASTAGAILRRDVAGILHEAPQISEDLRRWLAAVIEVCATAKPKRGRPAGTQSRDALIYDTALRLCLEFGLCMTRNADPKHPHRRTACDAIAKALAELGKWPTDYEGVLKAIKRRRRSMDGTSG